MKEYLSTCEMLEAGHKVSNTEQVLTILNRLNEEYESVVAVISSKRTIPSIEYVHSTLLTHEGRIYHKKPIDGHMTINYAVNYKGKGKKQQ